MLRNTGIPLFHYCFDGDRKVDEIVAAFLSAIGSFAQEASDQQLRVISFASNKFVWVQKGDIYIIALVASEDSTEIYSVILQEIAERFVGQFYEELQNLDGDGIGSTLHRFEGFTDIIEMILRRFDGIPGLARRYKMVLLPTKTVNMLKELLAKIEDGNLHRGAVITNDGYVVVSNLRIYEMEAILDMLPAIVKQECRTDEPMVISHASLDPKTIFIVSRLPQCVCGFVGRTGMRPQEYFKVMRPFVEAMAKIDLTNVKKLDPETSIKGVAFHDLDLVQPIQQITDVLENARVLFAGLEDHARNNTIKILRALSKDVMVGDIIDTTGLDRAEVSEALAILVARGIVQVNRIYPQLQERDDRFTAYLEIIGMPKKHYAVLDKIWDYCDGTTSIMEVSRKTGIPTSMIMEVLRQLGTHVKWKTERELLE